MKKLLQILFVILFISSTAIAQERTITGVVISKDDKLPLPGVSIKIKGATGGVSTDNFGRFSIKVKSVPIELTFSSLGYITFKKIVTDNTINVSLESDVKSLNEVVIAGAYGSEQTKRSQTGSVGVVNAKDLEATPLISVDKALQGRVAGVMSVSGNGQPGSNQNVRIRGTSSITAKNEPLYVIDGIPINTGDLSINATTTNALAGINPNDIESLVVLKDASASSIYGSRAANGVILITTKTGKAGKTVIRVDAEYGISKAAFLNDRNKPLNASQNRELTAEGLLNAGKVSSTMIPTLDAAYNYYDNTIVGTARQGINTNWIDVISQTGKQQQYNIAASGGNEQTQFAISGGYLKQGGTVIGTEFNRYSSNINVRHKFNDKLSFGINLNVSNSGQYGPSAGGAFRNPLLAAYFLNPYISPTNADGSINNSKDFSPGSVFNPLTVVNLDKNKYNALKGVGGADLTYKILHNLKFTSKIGIDYNNMEEDSYWNPDFGDGANFGGQSSRYYTRYFNWVATNLLSYSAEMLTDKSLVANIKAGYEAQKSSNYTIAVSKRGLPANIGIVVPTAGSVLNTANGENSDYTFASVLAIGDISYKNKYVVQASFRRDGSSRFSTNNTYGNFWSVGGSWNIDQEDFIKQYNWINQLKVRSSYGTNGNASIGNYDWRALYSFGSTYNYNSIGGSAPFQVGNQNLTWEINKPFDVGLDIALFKNRLALNLDYYSRKSERLLLDDPLSLTSGFTSFSNNVGSLRNRGIELGVSGTPVLAGGFKWDVAFNIAFNKNVLLELSNGSTRQISSFVVRDIGSNVTNWFMREWAGVDPTNGNPLWFTDATKTATTGNYGSALQVNTGKQADPKAFGSLTNGFKYKGISLDVMLYFSYGNYIRDAWAAYTQSDGANATFNRVASQMARWQNPDDVTNVPKYVYNNANSSNSTSTRFLYKGDYIRLRDITLGYDFPKNLLSTLKVSSIKIYARASNLYTWVKDKNLPYDPESFATSSTNFTVYNPKTIVFGVNVGF
ncbi:SusC/RagA family TonB-linked outer membrane protein [Pedobacter nototheniae]|uniref:SusC/RagA family TonB-linked outer membrane protein n=1 Tax=Pedobacter nototheniae TaxID=2488994 RepID=UPI00103968F4|nr:SusC/RagA family TonB-linked outer membrane protein [Pedobacter nototheniae]